MSSQKPLRRSNIFYHQRNLRNLSCPLYNLHLPHRTQPHIYARALCMPQSRPGFLVLHMDANATNRVHNILTLSAIMMDTTETGTTRKISTGRPVRYTFCPCRRFVPLCNHHGIVNVSFFFCRSRVSQNASSQDHTPYSAACSPSQDTGQAVFDDFGKGGSRQ